MSTRGDEKLSSASSQAHATPPKRIVSISTRPTIPSTRSEPVFHAITKLLLSAALYFCGRSCCAKLRLRTSTPLRRQEEVAFIVGKSAKLAQYRHLASADSGFCRDELMRGASSRRPLCLRPCPQSTLEASIADELAEAEQKAAESASPNASSRAALPNPEKLELRTPRRGQAEHLPRRQSALHRHLAHERAVEARELYKKSTAPEARWRTTSRMPARL